MTDDPASSPYPPPAVAGPVGRRRFPIALAALGVVVLAGGLAAWLWWPWVDGTSPTAGRAPETAPVPAAPPQAAGPTVAGPADADRIDRLAGQVDALGRTVAAAAPARDLEVLRSEVASLSHRLDTAGPGMDPQVLSGLIETVDGLKTRLAAAEAKLAERRTETHNQRVLVLAAAEIEAALADSAPFQQAVDLIREATGNDAELAADLAVLERHARTGLPSRVQLAQGLEALPARLAQPAPVPDDAPFGERVWHRVTGLVTIRRVEDNRSAAPAAGPPGPDRVLQEAAARLAAGDLAGAIDAVKGLDGPAGRIAAPWLEQAGQRLEAERAARALATTLAQRLGASGGD